jgi:hypothetical protein
MTTKIAARLSETETFCAEYQVNGDQHVYLDQMRPGQRWNQGDLYFYILPGKPPAAMKLVPDHNGQMAPGSSVGSRHVFDETSRAVMDFYAFANPTALSSNVLFLKAGTTLRLTHPEHRHNVIHVGAADAWVGCTFQRAHADELRAQAD